MPDGRRRGRDNWDRAPAFTPPEPLPAIDLGDRAENLPVNLFKGITKDILKNYSNHAVGIMFEAINRLRRIADRCEQYQTERGDALAALCAKAYGQLADGIIERVYGKHLEVGFTLRDQSQVPDWG